MSFSSRRQSNSLLCSEATDLSDRHDCSLLISAQYKPTVFLSLTTDRLLLLDGSLQLPRDFQSSLGPLFSSDITPHPRSYVILALAGCQYQLCRLSLALSVFGL